MTQKRFSKPEVQSAARAITSMPTDPTPHVVVPTLTERVKALLNEVDAYGIYPVEHLQKLIDGHRLGIKLPTSWKVTKSFIKTVERDGGFCRMAVGTAIIDGRGLMHRLMQHYGAQNTESFIGHGRQYYSDMECLFGVLSDKDHRAALEAR